MAEPIAGAASRVVPAPITASYQEDGTLAAVWIDYYALTPAGREDIERWIRAHQIDPAFVPIVVEIPYDSVHDEWRFPVFALGPNGRKYVDPATGEVAMRIVRRRCQPRVRWMRPAGQEN